MGAWRWIGAVAFAATLAAPPLMFAVFGLRHGAFNQTFAVAAIWCAGLVAAAGGIYLLASYIRFDSRRNGCAWWRSPLLVVPLVFVAAIIVPALVESGAGSLGRHLSGVRGQWAAVAMAWTAIWLAALARFPVSAMQSSSLRRVRFVVALEQWCRRRLGVWWLSRLPLSLLLAVGPNHFRMFIVWWAVAASSAGRDWIALVFPIFRAAREARDL